jgi:ribosomal protein L11 methylase PrmA
VNILAPVILKMLESGLSDLVESQGYLVLSGILEGQAGEVETAVQRNGMRIQETRQHGDWIAFLVEKLS